MKTRLLKKIRKEFKIELVESISHPDSWETNVIKQFSFPFYVLYENPHKTDKIRNAYKNYDEAYKSLQDSIKAAYLYKIKCKKRNIFLEKICLFKNILLSLF